MEENTVIYNQLKMALENENRDEALNLLKLECPVNNNINKNVNTPLHLAIRLEDYEIVEILLSKNASILSQNSIGDTPLHTAFKTRNNELTDFILSRVEQTNYVNVCNKTGLSHMHIACIRNKKDLVEGFLLEGAYINMAISMDAKSWPGYTALHFATEFKAFDVLDLLLRKGADVDLSNAADLTVSEFSKKITRDTLIIDYIIFYSLDLYPCSENTNFHLSCLLDDEDTVKKYVEFVPLINDPAVGRNLYCGDTPLHCAARSGNVHKVKILIENGALIDTLNEFNMTPLHSAFYQECISYEEDVVDYLLTIYDLKKSDNVTDKFGLSFFHIACTRGDLSVIDYFQKKGIDINKSISRNKEKLSIAGFTPLHLAVKYRQCKVIELLIKYGANINIEADLDCGTPLDYALYRTISLYFEEAKTILMNVPNVKDMIDENGSNMYAKVLNKCISRDTSEYIKVLAQRGCDINQRDRKGNTPMHYFYMFQDSDAKCLKTMLDLGADINAENDEGKLPIELVHGICHLKPAVCNVHYNNVEKLRILGYYISEKSLAFSKKIWDNRQIIDQRREFFTEEKVKEMKEKYQNELDKMKDFVIDNYSSLYTLLKANANTLAYYSENEKLLSIVDSENFLTSYPNYGYLMKLQLMKGKERKLLLELSTSALNFIIKNNLPAYCIERVISFLSNSDLENLIEIKNSVVVKNAPAEYKSQLKRRRIKSQ